MKEIISEPIKLMKSSKAGYDLCNAITLKVLSIHKNYLKFYKAVLPMFCNALSRIADHDSVNYKANSSNQHYKKVRNIEPYEQTKYHKELPAEEHYKQKKRATEMSMTPTKRPRDPAYRGLLFRL